MIFYLRYIQLLFFALFSIISICRSQNNFRFEHFTTEQGLSENYVYTIIQDSKGYLWMGTHDGLNRYDGYSFKKFRQNPTDSNSLPNNTINSLCEDRDGNIWIGTNAGVCKYDPVINKFTRLTLQNNVLGIQQVLMATATEVLVKTPVELFIINIYSLEDLAISADRNSVHKEKFYWSKAPVTKDKNGNIYMANNVGGTVNVWRYDSLRKSFADFASLPVDKSWAKQQLSFFLVDCRGRFHIALYGSDIITCTASSGTSQTDILKFKKDILELLHVFEDKNENFWIATTEGLRYYDKSKRTTVNFTPGISENTISAEIILSVMQDNTGIIWIATGNGINKLNPQQTRFSHLNTDMSTKPSLYNNFVLGIYAESNDIVRFRYNTANQFFSRYSFRHNTIQHFSVADYNYKKWIREFCFINPERLTDSILKNAIELIPFINKKGNPKPTGGIIIDNKRNLWNGPFGRSYLLNTSKYWDFNFQSTDTKIYHNEIWMATAGDGLICFDMDTPKIARYTASNPAADSINSSDITSLIIEKDGNIWVGTKGGGLNYFNRQKKTFQHFTKEDGLCNNSIYCMVKDNAGKIWMGTSNGLSSFDPATKIFKNYFRADGLINSEYNRQSACKIPDGTIFMGGMNGIDFFHPDNLSNNKNIPQVLVTDFKVFNKTIAPVKNLSLNHNENFITIEFAAMDFNNPSGNKFAYKLEGVDKDWVLLENRNFTTYSYLKPGRYLFLIKGANSDGVWNEVPAEYRFNILPAWYQTWWFYALLFITIASSVIILFRYRLLQKLKIFAVRQRIHRDLHDDVGATLSSVKAYSEILKDNPDNLLIAELIRNNSTEMLERLEVIAWATNPQHDNFKSLKNRMTKFAVPLCHSKNIQCNIESEGMNEEMLMPGEVRQNIFLVFKEAINNMMKYSEATTCSTRMYIQHKQFVMQIKDNGKGFERAIKESGSGLKNMQKRTEELNGKFSIESLLEKGTTIIIRIIFPFRMGAFQNTKLLG